MKVWLDDVRPMPEGFDVWAKTSNKAIILLSSGKVTHISFDHDLGYDPPCLDCADKMSEDHIDHCECKCHSIAPTGYHVACWIESRAFWGGLPKLTWAIHSANPVGRENIKAAMTNADRYWDK